MSEMLWACEAEANVPVPALTTADVKSDMSDEEWVCPSRETGVPFTVKLEAFNEVN